MVRKRHKGQKQSINDNGLTDDDIGAEGAKALSGVRKNNTTLTSLDLSGEEEERKGKEEEQE